jgi:hypothetical protein
MLTIDPSDSNTYDMTFELSPWQDISTANTYRIYSKLADTVEGNSGASLGLVKGGVVTSNSGEVSVMSRPYLYTIEVHGQRTLNPTERAKLSVLYQY